MRIATLTLFDETISGTSTIWYTPASTYEALGRGDTFAVAAAVYNVTGTPTLAVRVEHSADGQNWVNRVASGPEINQVITGASNTVFTAAVDGMLPVLLSLVRLRVQLSGATPQCRLKLTATTRGY
jgi:hypothetical protein